MLQFGRSIHQEARHFSTAAPRLAVQKAIAAAYYRGGTSRAVMFRKGDLPSDQSQWIHIFRSVIGSPDPNGRQLDGMGRELSSLSKVQLDSIRRQAVVAMGLAKDIDNVPGSIPKIAMVSAPRKHKLLSGGILDTKSCDVVVRAISVGQPHQAVPITVAMALATASRLPGSTVKECVAPMPVDPDGVTLGHNSGKILVGSTFDEKGVIEEAIVFRTARRLMEGKVYYK
ncbi:hypothetical protein INS49_004218 [Diaporthe citri]|uniref:uncharacterized protein n=1 Tax=Diaporthe citri TaxID=83186 RepID=UPI001C8221C3|nr:uncharacterized protein INS49_004218 [Diaporthe citri]KAG6355137.1 hypothetical protein INS49_004218 [Diaporthe citri]